MNSLPKKVAVSTLWFVPNYGSVLQAYATLEVLNDIGCDAKLINFTLPRMRYITQILGSNKSIFKKIKMLVTLPYKVITRYYKFTVFLKKHLSFTSNYNSYEQLLKSPPDADIYITGSDQVWNSDYNNGIEPFFFLDFLPESATRIAFSASIGMNSIGKDVIEQTTSLLKKYSAISVREKNAIKIIEDLGIKNVVHILDPTLILNKEEWSKVAAPKHKKIPKDYLFVYELHGNEKLIEYARKIAKSKDLILVKLVKSPSMKSKGFINIANVTISQYLSLIKNANYLVTDSFHGTAFSLNFNKQFAIVLPPKYESRITSILQILDVDNNIIRSDSDIKRLPFINYNTVNSNLDKCRDIAKRFLRTNIYG